MNWHILRGVTATVLLATVACAASAQSTVTTSASFYRYDGPVGAPIYAGSPPFRDPAQYDSYFQNLAGTTVQVTPQLSYPGYEAPAFAGTGTATLSSSGFTFGNRFSFWNRISNAVDETHNTLEITGAVTPGVTINPATGHSGEFKLGTLSFTNGNWFSTHPAYNPGFGLLYPASHFAFSMIATPDPFIGTSGFPGYHVWNDTVVLDSMSGPGTPDELSFENSPWLGKLTVDEGVTGSVEIWGHLGSLDPVELRNPSAGVTLIASVPEPETYAMLVAGLGLLAVASRRRSGKRKS